MCSIFDLKDHEHFSSYKLSIKARGWIIEIIAQSMVLIDDFFPLVLETTQLLTANLRIFDWNGSLHHFKVLNILFQASYSC